MGFNGNVAEDEVSFSHEESWAILVEPNFDKSSRFISRIEEGLKNETDLPAFPSSVRQLERLLKHEAGLGQLAGVIEKDIGLSARYLKVANSPIYRGSTTVHSIHDALLRIGFTEVKRIAMADGFVTSFAKLPIKVDWKRFWTHSLLTARLCERITDIYEPPETFHYLSGLLHDVGKLTLQTLFPKEFGCAVEKAAIHGRELYMAEKEIFGITHAEIGAYHCARWGLEPATIQAVLYHHHPEEASDGEGAFEAACLCVANTLATGCNENLTAPHALKDITDLNQISIWSWLRERPARRAPYIPLVAELGIARATVEALI